MTKKIDWKTIIEQTLVETNDGDSHTEIDPQVFHASQIGHCKRQATISKLGLSDHGPEVLGNFLPGTLFHGWMEDNARVPDHVHFEIPIRFEDAGILWVGHADVYDESQNVIYDFKTRGDYFHGDFQYLDPPVDRHVDQLSVYMRGLECSSGQIIYIDKKNPTHVRTWPEDDLYDLNMNRYRDCVRKATEIKDWLTENGVPESKAEIPFEKCGCFVCEQESELEDKDEQ